MATGTNIKTYVEGRWHDADLAIMRAADHGSWLGTTVFDGARFVNGLTPDLAPHCARVNKSAEALLITPTMGADEMEAIIRDGLKSYAPGTAVYQSSQSLPSLAASTIASRCVLVIGIRVTKSPLSSVSESHLSIAQALVSILLIGRS